MQNANGDIRGCLSFLIIYFLYTEYRDIMDTAVTICVVLFYLFLDCDCLLHEGFAWNTGLYRICVFASFLYSLGQS